MPRKKKSTAKEESNDDEQEVMLPIKSASKKKRGRPVKKSEPTTTAPTTPTKKTRRRRKKKPCPKGHEVCDCPKRKPSAYAQFVKDNYNSVRSLPCCDRFKELGKRWKAHKEKKSK
jgi:hypothetical protein